MIDNSTLAKVKSTVEAKDATISKNTGAIFSILTESVYSNPRQAGIREIISNALDANTRAKSDKPVQIKHPTQLSTKFSVRDFGNGLTVEEIGELYTSLGASSKKEVEDEIGFFGIGALSPLAYVDQFTVESFRNGQLDIYSIYAGDNGIPQVAKVASTQTKEPNGLCVTYNVKNGEISLFTNEIITVLSYIPPQKYTTVLKIVYFKDSLKANNALSISFDDNIFICAKSYYIDTKNTIVMGGVCYEFDSKIFKSTIFNSHSMAIEAPIGAVSVQASREKLRLNNKTIAYIETVLKYIESKSEKELQKQIDNSKSFLDAMRIQDRMTLIKINKKLKWNGHVLCMDYLFGEMLKYFEIKRKYGKNFYTYGTDEYKRRFYSQASAAFNYILDDVARGGLIRILKSNNYHDNIFALVQKDSAKTEEFTKNFGNFILEKTSNLAAPDKKVKVAKVKTKKYLINKTNNNNYATFIRSTSEFNGDYNKFDGYYIIMKNKTIVYDNKKISLSDVTDVVNITDKEIMIIDWEETNFPPNASCFFNFFIKNIQLEKNKYFSKMIFEGYTHGNVYSTLYKYRDDYKKEISKFNLKSNFYYQTQGHSLISNLGLKIDLSLKTKYDGLKDKIDIIIEKNYPLLNHLSWGAFQDDCIINVKKYILTVDQNLFDSCFN